MAKSTRFKDSLKELQEKALAAADAYKLFFVEDVVAYMPCSRSTFYELGLDKSDALRDLLEQNKIQIKVAMRKKWFASDNATLQMGLMRLVSSDEERAKLSMSYQETGEPPLLDNNITINIVRPGEKVPGQIIDITEVKQLPPAKAKKKPIQKKKAKLQPAGNQTRNAKSPPHGDKKKPTKK